MSPARRLFIVVVGCGRLGSYLANALSREGHSLVVVDVDEAAFHALSAEYSGFRLEGDATEFAVLVQAKIDKADAVVVTTHNDNINLMVAQVASRLFHVPRVLARVFDPDREASYRDLGIETVSPTSLAGGALLASLAGATSPSEGDGA